MTTTLVTQISFNIVPRYTKTIDLVPAGLAIAPSIGPPQLTLPNGSGSGQANLCVVDSRTVAASTNDDLNLTNGSLLDPFGAGAVFTKINGIYIRVTGGAGMADGLKIGGAGSGVAFLGPFDAASAKINIPSGGWQSFVHPGGGWAVTPSTHDVFRIANGGATGPINYDLVLIGAS